MKDLKDGDWGKELTVKFFDSSDFKEYGPPHRNHHFCYTFLLIFNISPPGPFSKSMGIINVCSTYKLKHSFSISQEIDASEHCAKKPQFFANQNHQKTIGFTIRIAPHRPQHSPPTKSIFLHNFLKKC